MAETPSETDPAAGSAGGGETDAAGRLVLAVVLASATLTVMAGAIIGPVVREIQMGVGVSGPLAGLVVTTHGICIVLVSPLAGALVDRVGPRRPYLLGLFLYGVGGGAGLFAETFGPLLLSRVVLGTGVAFVYTGVTVLIFRLYQGRAMDRALGLRSSANSLGAAVWPLVGGGLGAFGWQAPFGVYLVALPLGLLALAAVPETADRGEAGGSDGEPLAVRVRSFLGLFRRRPAIPAVYLLHFGANVFLYAVVVYYPQLLARFGVTATPVVGLYLAANGLASAAVAATYDRLAARAGRHRLVLAALGLWGAGFLGASLVGTPLTALLPVVLVGLGVGLTFPTVFSWVEALAPPGLEGSLSSYLASAGYLGQFVSPLAFGVVLGLSTLRGVFASAAVVAVLAVAVLAAGIVLHEMDATGAGRTA